MDIREKVRIIQDYFWSIDDRTRRQHGMPFFDTKFGIWGASNLLDTYELFLRMRLDERRAFVDLGAGDGRIVLLAALFTDAVGIEGDERLVKMAEEAKEALIGKLPELSRCRFIHADYTQEDLSGFDVLFTFADHPWSEAFEEKLMRECKGILLSYNKIFLPRRLKKGKTYWVQQLPIVSYPLNVEEEDLFHRREF